MKDALSDASGLDFDEVVKSKTTAAEVEQGIMGVVD